MVITQRVAELHNKYVVKQSREVPGKQRRSLSAGERQALENLQSKWQSRGVTSEIYSDEALGRSQWLKTSSLRGDQLMTTGRGIQGESEVYPQSIQSQPKPTFSNQTPIRSTVLPAPTRRKQYKDVVGREGAVKGSLAFAGYKTQGFFEKREQRGFLKQTPGRTYGSAGLSKTAGGVVRYAPYFSPAGAFIIGAEGAEDIGTKKGRARLKERKQNYINIKGFSPRKAKLITYGTPIVMTGLGAFGVRSQLKSFAKPKFSSGFIAEEIPKGAYSDVTVTAPFSVGKKQYVAVSEQRVFGGNKVSFGAGKGYLLEGRKSINFPSGRMSERIDATPFKQVGVSKEAGKAFYVKGTNTVGGMKGVYVKTGTKIGDDIKISQMIGGFKPIGKRTQMFVGGEPTSMRWIPSGLRVKAPKQTSGFIIKQQSQISKNFKPLGSQGLKSKSVPTLSVQKSVLSQIGNIQSAAKSKIPKPIPSKIYAPTAQITKQRVFATTTSIPALSSKMQLKSAQIPKQTSRQVPRVLQTPTIIPKTGVTTRQVPRFIQSPMLKQSSKSSFRSPPLNFHITPRGKKGGIPIIPIMKFPKLSGAFGGSTRKFSATPKYRYTPSYSALVFGIKGKKPSKKFYTGFEMRPITTKKWWKNK